MEIVHERAAGMDISKRDAKVCIRVPGTRAGSFSKTVTTYGAMTNEILRLRRDLEVAAVTVVVLSVTLNDDEASSCLTMGFGGCGRHCDVVVVSGDGGDCRGRHDDGGFRACRSTPARDLRCARVGAGADRG